MSDLQNQIPSFDKVMGKDTLNGKIPSFEDVMGGGEPIPKKKVSGKNWWDKDYQVGTSNGVSPKSEEEKPKTVLEYVSSITSPEQKSYAKPKAITQVTSFKKNERPFDQTKEEAVTEITEKVKGVAGSHDPVGKIEDDVKKGSTNDAMQYQMVRNQIESDLSHVPTARKWLFQEGKEFDPNNKTDQFAKKSLEDYQAVKGLVVNNGGDFAKAATQYYAKDDKRLQNLVNAGQLPDPSTQGELVYRFLQDDKVRQLSNENQDFHNLYKEQETNFKQNYPQLWTNILVQKIAQGREDYGMNNPFLNLAGVKSADKVIEKLYEDGEIDRFDVEHYEKEARPLLELHAKKTPTTGFLENAFQSAAKGIEDIPKGVYDLTGISNMLNTKAEKSYQSLEDDANQVGVNPKGLAHKVSYATGNLTGVLLPMIGGAKVLQATNILRDANAANQLMMGVQFYHDLYKDAERENPNGGYLNQLQATIQAAVFAKINPLLGNLSKTVVKEAAPEIKNILSKLQSDNISGAAAKEELTKTLLSKIGDKVAKGGEISTDALKVGGEMSLAAGLNDVIGGIFSGKFDADKTAQNMAHTFESMVLGTPLLSMMKVSGNKDVTRDIVNEISSNPEYFKAQIEKTAAEDPEFAKQAPQLLQNLEHLTAIKESLDRNTDLNPAQKKRVQLIELHKRILDDKIKSSPADALVRKEAKERAALDIEEEMILDPEMGNKKFVEEMYNEDLLPKGSRMILEDAEGKFAPNKVGEYLKFIAQQANGLNEEWKPVGDKKPTMEGVPEQIIEAANERWAKEIEAAQPKSKAAVIMPEDNKAPDIVELKRVTGGEEDIAENTVNLQSNGTEAQNISGKENQGTSNSTQSSREESPEALGKRYKRVADENDFVDPYDRAVKYFADGGRINPSELERIFGGKGDKGARISLMKNDAGTVKQIAHYLWETDQSGKYEDTHFIDAVESALRDFSSKSAMQKDIADRYDFEAAQEKYLQQTHGKEAIDIVEKMSEEEINHILQLDAEKAGEFIDELSFKNEQSTIPPTDKENKQSQQPPTEEIKPIEQPIEDKSGAGTIPPKPPKETISDLGEGGKELDKLANNIPDSGKVSEYMSKDTIEKYTGEEPTNDQRRGVQELEIALNHGEKIIEKAKELFGKDYAEKTLDYIDNSTAGVSNKALMYVSLENALGREKLADPSRTAEITKQQALVYEQSQKFARENSLALNYQKLRKLAKAGYDIDKITDNFFSAEEKVARNDLKKAIEADADTINKESELQETGAIAPEVEKAISEGVAKEVAKIYEAMPKDKRSAVDRAISTLESVQKKLRSKTYDAGIGIPVAIIDGGISVIKLALKAGVKIADAVELGIKHIKEKYGKDWKKENEFRKDILDAYKEEEVKTKPTKEIVKEALIEKGFGREVNIKGEKKKILDWKKLAGAAGTISKIRENVNSVLEQKGLAGLSDAKKGMIKEEFIQEYVDLRASVIEKSQNELARRNKETITPDQKTAAKKLAELYTYGLFEAKSDAFENTLNKALGAKVSEQGFNEAKEIAKAMETIYSQTFKGVRLNDVSAKAAIERLEDKLRVLLFREAKKQGNTNLKLANFVRTYFEVQQTMLLNNLKQAFENPFSGLQQNAIDALDAVTKGESNPALRTQRREVMKTIYKDMVVNGGITYGKVESQFVNRQHLDDHVNKLSDNKLYHGIMSVITGKATLNAADAMYKAALTEKKFAGNLITILTHNTNPKKMGKKEALKFVTEHLTGQTYEDAKITSKQVIEKINKEARKELIPANQTQIDRLANDIVKASLEMGNKISTEEIQAAYNAAYRAAGLGLGHEANNMLSSTLKGYSAKMEGDINRAIKDKEWNRATALTYKSVLFRNILNPFVGGGTNWLVLKLEKTGLGLFTGLAYKVGSKSDIDLSTPLGQKRLEARLYNQSRWKDNFNRGLVGGMVSVLSYAAFTQFEQTDEYRKWRAKNRWAARYLDVITPEPILARMAIKDKKIKQYAANSFNKNDAFDGTNKLIKAVEFAAKGDKSKAWGALGESIGMKINAPLPWRLVKDGQVLYQGIKGEDPWHGNYKPSEGFASGVLQGGVVEWLGGRPVSNAPEKTFTIKDPETFKERQATEEEVKKFETESEKKYQSLKSDYEKGEEDIWVDVNGKVHISKENISDQEFDTWKDSKVSKLTPEQKKQFESKVKAKASREVKKELFGDEGE